jgi:surfeit locus 1 family protein
MTEGRRRLLVLLAALLVAGFTARLGFWQLDRARQKTTLREAIEQRGALPPLTAAELPRRADGVEAVLHRRIRLAGRWAADRTVYLDNRQMDGRPGFFVVTPLLLPSEAGGGAVLVQRGWVPRHVQDRSRLPPIDTATGPLAFEGRIALPPARLYEFDGQATGAIRQNLDLSAFARETGLDLAPLSVLQLTPDAAGSGDGLRRDWPLPAVDVSRHLGYAAQWFAFSALAIVLYAWFQLLRPRLRRARR